MSKWGLKPPRKLVTGLELEPGAAAESNSTEGRGRTRSRRTCNHFPGGSVEAKKEKEGKAKRERGSWRILVALGPERVER